MVDDLMAVYVNIDEVVDLQGSQFSGVNVLKSLRRGTRWPQKACLIDPKHENERYQRHCDRARSYNPLLFRPNPFAFERLANLLNQCIGVAPEVSVAYFEGISPNQQLENVRQTVRFWYLRAIK
jgi:hypothetical protein